MINLKHGDLEQLASQVHREALNQVRPGAVALQGCISFGSTEDCHEAPRPVGTIEPYQVALSLVTVRSTESGL